MKSRCVLSFCIVVFVPVAIWHGVTEVAPLHPAGAPRLFAAELSLTPSMTPIGSPTHTFLSAGSGVSISFTQTMTATLSPPRTAVPSSFESTRNATERAASGVAQQSLRWERWMECWAAGAWTRLNESAVQEKRGRYAQLTPPSIATMDNWTWVLRQLPAGRCPPALAYEEIDRIRFCKLLGGRNIFLLGDSMTGQFTDSLLRLLWGKGPTSSHAYPPVHPRYPYSTPIYSKNSVCDDFRPVRLVHLLNWAGGHLLLKSQLTARDMHNISSACAKAPALCPHYVISPGSPEDRIWGIDEFLINWPRTSGVPPGIIVMNAGLHYKPTEVLLTEVRTALALITRLYPTLLVVWRNTAAGHDGCSAHAVPLATIPLASASVNKTWQSNYHHWDLMPAQNVAVSDVIRREFPSVVYMDVSTSTDLRADMHAGYYDLPPSNRDCLHYRPPPSPVDNWVRMFYNIVRLYELW